MFGLPSRRLKRAMVPVLLLGALITPAVANAGTLADTQVENTATVTYADSSGVSYQAESNLVATPIVVGGFGTDGSITQQAEIVAGFNLDITVTDTDLNLSPTTVDTVRVYTVNERTVEAEYSYFFETGVNTGVFTGTLATYYSPAAGPTDDGVLFAQPEDVLRSSYVDAETAAGIAVTRDVSTVVLPTVITLDAMPDVIVANGSDISVLTARVTDNADVPLPDGTIVLFTADKGTFENGTGEIEVPISGGNGEATTTLTAPVLAKSDTARVVASFAGFDSDRILLEVLPGALAIRVYDQVREAIVTAADPTLRVQVTLTGSTVTGDPVEYVISVDRTGLFIVPEIPPGTYQLSVLVVDKNTERVVFDGLLQEITVNPDGSVTRPSNAVTGMVHGRGESSGARYEGVEVALLNDQGTVVATTTTDADGRYSFDGVPSGSYTIRVTMPDGTVLTGTVSSRSRHAGEVIVNADVLIDPFGRTFDAETGAVIPNVTVTLKTLTGETLPIPGLSGTGATPNVDNVNPYVTTSEGKYAFLFGGDQVGTSAKPARYIMAVDPPAGSSYPPRRMYLTVRPTGTPSGKLSNTARTGRTAEVISMDVESADGLELALPNSFTLTSGMVSIPDIETIAFNIPLYPNAPVLTVSKLTQTDSVSVGESVDFTIEVANLGNETAAGVTLGDTLTSAWQLVASDATEATANALRWDLGDMAPGDADTLHLTVTATSDAATPGDLANTAWVRSATRLPTYSEATVVARGAPDIAIVKSAGTDGVAPGEEVEYALDVTTPPAYTGTVTVRDPLPDALTYVDGSSTPAASYDSLTHTLVWTLSGASDTVRSVTFSTTPRSDLDPGEVPTKNMASVTVDTLTVYSNAVDVVISVPYLSVRKTADLTSVQAGDIVVYRVEVANLSSADTLHAVTVRDLMPHGFGFASGSARLDGVAMPPGSLVGRDLAWNIGTLEPRTTRNLSYRLVVGVGAQDGTGVNVASATALSESGAPVAAEPSRATVVVREGPFEGDELILGRAWVDLNDNGLHDGDEPPVPGVILLMEDGTRVVADGRGRFSIPEVQTGTHVLRLLDHAIPEGLAPSPLGTRSGGDPWTRFVTVSRYGMAKANFPFRPTRRVRTAEITLERTIRPLDPLPAWWRTAHLDHGTVFFEEGDADLTDAALAVLDSLLPMVKEPCVRLVSINGHADPTRIRNRTLYPSNHELSLARAHAVRSWLMRSGLDSTRIVARAYGETRPTATNLSREGRASNRRAEITIVCLPETMLPGWEALVDSSVLMVPPEIQDISSVVYFRSGSDTLDREAIYQLRRLVEGVKDDYVMQVDLTGHADPRGVRRTRFRDNLALSRARADAVKNWLVETGIDSARFVVKAAGADIPVAPNSSEETRRVNRRVEITLEYMASCDTVRAERAEVVYSLRAEGVVDTTEYRVATELPRGVLPLTAGSLDSLPLMPEDSVRAVLARRGGGFDDLPDPVLVHPLAGPVPLQPLGVDSLDSTRTRWSMRFELVDSLTFSNKAALTGAPGVTPGAASVGAARALSMADVYATGGAAYAPVSSASSASDSADTTPRWIWQEQPSAVRAPVPGQVIWIETPVDSTVSYRDRLTVLAKGLVGTPMTLTVNGERIEEQIVRPDARADFLNVPAPPGPVTLAISQRLPNGVVLRDSVHVHVIGPVARVTVDHATPSLPADSLSQTTAAVRAYDEWGMPLRDDQMVTITVDKGHVLTRDVYPETPGTQVPLRNGGATVLIGAADEVGMGRVVASVSGVSAQAEIDYTTPYEKGIIIGVAEGQIGWKHDKNAPAGVRPSSDFDGGAYAKGRAAVFARGTVGDGYLLTTSYDSDREFDDQVYRHLTPERSYPIHGDGSSVAYEAPSASKLFVRVEKGESHAQYGDFATNMTKTELAAYNRTFTGVSTAGRTERVGWNVFGASTAQSIQVDEIPGEGISGQYYLSASSRGVAVVEGSERVVLQTRDRLHPEIVLHEESMYRFVDYEIDYRNGTLLFKQPVGSVGPGENPVYIVATYEAAHSLDHHTVAGGRVALRSGETWELGGSLIGEERTDADYWLTGLDARSIVTPNLLLNTEIARSSQEEQGWAWKVGAQSRGTEKFGYEVYYRAAGRDFYNPNSTTAQAGVSKARGRFTWTPTGSSMVTGEGFHTRDDVNDETRTSTTLGGSYRLQQFTGRASMEVTTAERTGTETQGAILTTGVDWATTRDLTLSGERQQNFLDQDASYRPTLNKVQAKWSPLESTDFVAEHAFTDKSLLDSSYTLIGVQSRVTDNATAYANYKLDDGINGETNEAIVGMRNRMRLHSYVTATASFERKMTLRGNRDSDFYSYGIGAEYLPPDLMKASARFEQRNGRTLDKIVAAAAGDLVVARQLSLLGDYTYLDEGHSTDSTSKALRSHDFIAGLAWRGASNDLVNVLGKYEYKNEFNSLIAPSTRRTVHIGSVEGILEPRSQLEWYLRYAFKVAALSSEGLTTRTLTDLWMTSLRYEWTAAWDVQGEYRILTQHTADDVNHGLSAEVGHVLNRSARVAVGYNFTGYNDRDFAGMSFWAQGPYLKIQVKFTEAEVAGSLHGLQRYWREK